MRIAADISQIVYEGTGSARYELELLKAVDHENTQKDIWTFFLSSFRREIPRKVQTLLDKHDTKQLPLPPTLIHTLWNEIHTFPLDLFIGKQDWIITSDWAQPPTTTSRTATIVHDLAFVRYPEVVPPKLRKSQMRRLEWAKKEAKTVLALSKTTRQDLLNLLHFPAEKVKTLYPAVDIQQPTEEQKKITQQKFKLSFPFILSVGKIEPRKNLKRLIEAYSQLQTETHLVIVGPPGWEELRGDHPNVHFTGFVSDEELYSLYSLSTCFIMPSLWEGFGFPLVEAMKLGTPTLTSNVSSLKELGENTSLLFDPLEVHSIRNALDQVLSSEELRTKLIAAGKQKSRLFSLQNYYNNLTEILRENM